MAPVTTGTPADVHAENVEFLLRHHPCANWQQMSDRLSLQPDSLRKALQRSGRPDLIERLNRNAELGHH